MHLPSKGHQTVLFVDGAKLSENSSYRERVIRLAGCVNGSAIKVDVVTLVPGGGVTAVSGLVTDAPVSDVDSFDIATLQEAGADAGYNLTLIAS